MRRFIALSALLLPGCDLPSASSGGAVPVPSEFKGWRLLSRDAPGTQAKPTPAGFAEVRSLKGSGSYYLVYDAGYRPVGHVTAGGHAVRYAPAGRGPDTPMGEGPVLEQMAGLLGASGALHPYTLDGKPRDLP